MIERGRIIRGDSWAADLQDDLAWPPRDMASWMEEHTRLLKRDRHSRVGLFELQQQLCCLKFYAYKSVLQRWRYQLGSGRATNSFDIARRLIAEGLPVPRPLACVRVDAGVLLLSEGIGDACNLESCWQEEPAEVSSRQLLVAAGTTLARLHRAGFAHGDCKWRNLLCCADEVWLIDLDAACKTSVGSARQLRDLARFTLNAEELGVGADAYGLFLESYCRDADTSPTAAAQRMLPILKKLRTRHLARYGKCGQQLI